MESRENSDAKNIVNGRRETFAVSPWQKVAVLLAEQRTVRTKVMFPEYYNGVNEHAWITADGCSL